MPDGSLKTETYLEQVRQTGCYLGKFFGHDPSNGTVFGTLLGATTLTWSAVTGGASYNVGFDRLDCWEKEVVRRRRP